VPQSRVTARTRMHTLEGGTPTRLLQSAWTQERRHAFIGLDPDGRVREWGRAARLLFGYAAEEMLGLTLERLYLPEDVKHGEHRWALDAARSYGQIDEDRWMRRQDGARVWISSTTTALHTPSGEPEGFVRICRDRTDLRTHVESLQARLDRAMDSERRFQQVLGTLAHEVRNPLGDIAIAGRIVGRLGAGDARLRQCAESIERQVAFIERMVADLLESTRAALGKARLQCEALDVAALLDDAVQTCRSQLVATGQDLQVTVPEPPVEATLDRVRIKQVLVNLLSNASKFSANGARIWLKAHAEDGWVVIRVEDKGRGIPRELMPRLFEAFSQATTEGHTAGGGLGLGLVVVKRIVDMHGGTVAVMSEGHGQGVEVVVRLPLRQPQPV